MGRSVSVPSNAVAVAYRSLELEPYENDEGDIVPPCDLDYEWEYDCMIDNFIHDSQQKWPSLVRCDEWFGENHVLLKNDFAYLGVSEYCGLISMWVVPRTNDYDMYDDPIANLCVNWCDKISSNFEKTFSVLRSIGRMSNGEQVFEKVG